MGCNSSNSNSVDEAAAKSIPPENSSPAPTPVVAPTNDAAKVEEVKPAEPTKPAEAPIVDCNTVHSVIRWNKKSIEEVSEMLNTEGAANFIDPNNGNAPIHIAAQNGHLELVKLLIEKGADVNVQNKKGNSALHMAVGYDYYECAVALIGAGADEELKNEGGSTAKTGIDGDTSLGITALLGAKTTEQISKAFDLCEERIEEVTKIKFAQAGLKTKKANKDQWTDEIKTRFLEITNRLS